MSVYSYARFSTDRQSESSVSDQHRINAAHAAAQGWRITAEHSDEGISGAALGNRPGVQAVLGVLRTGDILILTDLSRLSRSQDLAPLITRLRHRGVRVIGVQDGYDSESRTARMQAGLSGIMSEEFRSMVADRTRSALEARARIGQPTGGRPYENSEIVREIFARFVDGESMKAIASDLNRREIPSPGANWKARSNPRGHWLVSTLHAMLQNERYAGRIIWNRSQWVKDPDTGKRIRRERPESEWIVQSCEPMVDAETWRLAQSRFSKQPGRGGVPRYLLSGLLVCGICGSKLIVMGGGQHRYICGAYHAGGEHACSNRQTFPRKLAEEMILPRVVERLLSPEAIEEGVRQMREARKALEAPQPRESEEVKALERLVREGILSADTAAPALTEARRKAQAQRSEIPNLPWPSEKAWRVAVENMAEVLQGDDISAARQTLQEIVGTVRCLPAAEYVIAEVGRDELAATGTGRWVSITPPLPIHIPVSTRR